MRRPAIGPALLSLAVLLLASAVTRADYLVSDLDSSSVFRVDSTNGNRSIFSGGAVGSGVAFSDPQGIVQVGSGPVLVVDDGLAGVVQVDPMTGNRTLLSGTGAGSGQAFVLPFGIASGGGAIYVSDAGDMAGDGFIVRVDGTTGARTLISGLGAGSGDAFGNIRGLVVLGGELYVSDLANQAVYRVDPTSGARTIVSDATHGTGDSFGAPLGLTVDGAGNLLVADPGNQAVYRVDPLSGNRTLLSGTGMGSGPLFALPSGILLDAAGRIRLTDSGDFGINSPPALFDISPTSGNRTIVSNFANGTGPNFQNLDLGIAELRTQTIPEPSSLALASIALTCGLVVHLRRARDRQ